MATFRLPSGSRQLKALIAVTDHDWFQFLRQQPQLDEINFWRPSDTRTPQQLKPGTIVLFKLKKRFGDWIVGWATFERHDVLPAWLAWDAFEHRNGAGNFVEMRQRIESLRPGKIDAATLSGDYPIGCLMLSQPVFLADADYVRPPAGWPKNAVQGKAYDLATGEGARVWRECLARTSNSGVIAEYKERLELPSQRYGDAVMMKPRLGQGIFRIAVMDAYGHACAVTTEHSLPALEAAHIKPYSESGAHEVPNGLLLRSDIHRLFDKGYVGVTPDLRFVASSHLKADYKNGRSYYPLDGQAIHLPKDPADHPDRLLLEWHMDERFRR